MTERLERTRAWKQGRVGAESKEPEIIDAFMTGCLPMSLICRLEMTRHINFVVSLAI